MDALASTSHDGHMLKAERTVFQTSAIPLERKNMPARASFYLCSARFDCNSLQVNLRNSDVDHVRHVSRPT